MTGKPSTWRKLVFVLKHRWPRLLAFWLPAAGVIVGLMLVLPQGWGWWVVIRLIVLCGLVYAIYLMVVRWNGGTIDDANSYLGRVLKDLATGSPLKDRATS